MSTEADDVRRPRFAALRFLLSLSFRADPRRTLVVVFPFLPIAFAVMPASMRVVIDAIPRDDTTRIVVAALVVAVTLVVGVAVGFSQFKVSVRLGDSIGYELDRRLIEITSSVPGIAHFEQPDHLDRMEMLRTQRFALRDAMSNVKWSIEGFMGVVVSVGLLASVHPLLALLPLASIPAVALGGPAQRGIDDAVAASAERSRRALHLFDVATLPGPAKEIRVFGLREELLDRYRGEWHGGDDMIDRAERRAALVRISGTVIAAAGYALGLWFLVHEIRHGRVSAGDVYVALSTATRLTDQMGRSAGTLGALRHARNVAERFLWLDDYAAASRPAPASAAAPLELRYGIDFHDVSFAYEGAAEPSLRDVTLHLPAGSVVALVGENGAGKSTLLKLLFGFYEPTAGEIRIDQVPLAAIGSLAWRGRTAACVQDHARFFVPAGETIGIGDLDALHDHEAVVAATRRAAAEDVIDGLATGYDELLGPLRGGVDLSGGQWQKLAIARAMMREQPLLVALDEPTSALDPLAEHEMFERYTASAQALAARQGTVTVLVSHRFSTVRIADLIVVIDDGAVREIGNHDELIAIDGLYAELYALQAHQYR